jgi:hypothetical protein
MFFVHFLLGIPFLTYLGTSDFDILPLRLTLPVEYPLFFFRIYITAPCDSVCFYFYGFLIKPDHKIYPACALAVSEVLFLLY